MADMLIRGVPDDVVAALDIRARQLGLSRSEYVLLRLDENAAVADSLVSAGELARGAARARPRLPLRFRLLRVLSLAGWYMLGGCEP